MGLQVRRNLYTTNQNQTMSLKQIGYVLVLWGVQGWGEGVAWRFTGCERMECCYKQISLNYWPGSTGNSKKRQNNQEAVIMVH